MSQDHKIKISFNKFDLNVLKSALEREIKHNKQIPKPSETLVQIYDEDTTIAEHLLKQVTTSLTYIKKMTAVQDYYYYEWHNNAKLKRPCRNCIHSHFKKGDPRNNCSAHGCLFEPKNGNWQKWFDKFNWEEFK